MTPQTFTFEGAPLQVLQVDGRSAWIAREIGKVLGYAKEGKGLIDTINQRWEDEFIYGIDCEIFRGVYQTPLNENSNLKLANPRGHLVLFESGLHLALLKTSKPLGRQLRRWLVSDVLPQIAKTGAYSPNSAQAGDDLSPSYENIDITRKNIEASQELRKVCESLRKSGAPNADLIRIGRAAAALLAPSLGAFSPEPSPVARGDGILTALMKEHGDGVWRKANRWADFANEFDLIPTDFSSVRARNIWMGHHLMNWVRAGLIEVKGHKSGRRYRMFFQPPTGDGQHITDGGEA